MATDAPPALRLDAVVVKASLGGAAPVTPHAPRDLPDLARFLFFALAPAVERDVKVLDKVTLEVARGACVALVGEDAAGKTTLARVCARLARPTRGTVFVDGLDVHRARGAAGLNVRRALQVLLDDDEAALDPRLHVEESLALADAALGLTQRGPRTERFVAALERAQLGPDVLLARAGALTAGQRKRVALARALLAEPSAIVVDEPAGGLDPFGRGVILDTLGALSARPGGPALLVLTKDLAAARTLARKVGVLRRGALVEIADTDALFSSPQHPYTQALVAAAPRMSP